ncbi:MAG: hypothetical protein D6725_16320, partial [Planctomycetota bacterium]
PFGIDRRTESGRRKSVRSATMVSVKSDADEAPAEPIHGAERGVFRRGALHAASRVWSAGGLQPW